MLAVMVVMSVVNRTPSRCAKHYTCVAKHKQKDVLTVMVIREK